MKILVLVSTELQNRVKHPPTLTHLRKYTPSPQFGTHRYKNELIKHGNAQPEVF